MWLSAAPSANVRLCEREFAEEGARYIVSCIYTTYQLEETGIWLAKLSKLPRTILTLYWNETTYETPYLNTMTNIKYTQVHTQE